MASSTRFRRDLLLIGIILFLLEAQACSPTCDMCSCVPTGPQLHYQGNEIAGLTHFNMQTFTGELGCGSAAWLLGANNPATFQPKGLNISDWVRSYKALGAKHAILTAKHNCGFLLFKTNTKLPNGTNYPYGVAQGGGTFPEDIVDEFVKELTAAGLGVGFYYSTGNNMFLNRANFGQASPTLLPGMVNVTDEEYKAIVLAQLEELWSRYANMFTEIWFDGGYGGFIKSEVTTLLQKYQPQAAAFGGVGIGMNPLRWIGTEMGDPLYPVWSTGASNGAGNMTSPNFVPPTCDTTLQDDDTWFWDPTKGIRSLSELIQVYHLTVGQNCVLEMDFAIDTTGNVHPTHAAQYAALGDWIRTCYGSPVSSATDLAGPDYRLTIAPNVTFDRFILREDQSLGQRIRQYSISVDGRVVGTGTSIGNKRIHLLESPLIGPAMVTLSVNGVQPILALRQFSAFSPCLQ
jgi:alpha-L-fucosidase